MSLAARRLAAGVLLVGALAWALAWLLAGGQADVAAAAVLGLAVLPVLDEPRHRTELIRAAGGPMAVAAVVWLLAEALRRHWCPRAPAARPG